jgi:hypothetical protein
MKYEMIFGDQKRFNEQNNEMAEVMLWHDRLGQNFVSIKELSRMNLEGAIPHGSVVLAVRRIIAEPKHWTLEDKKAGRLPELGAEFMELGQNKPSVVIKHIDGCVVALRSGKNQGAVTISNGCFFPPGEAAYPIETPDEKAQREEDEFVESTCRQNEPHSTLYSDGVRAAYRKLKGGE